MVVVLCQSVGVPFLESGVCVSECVCVCAGRSEVTTWRVLTAALALALMTLDFFCWSEMGVCVCVCVKGWRESRGEGGGRGGDHAF